MSPSTPTQVNAVPHIIVATDLSTNAMCAVEVAAELATTLAARISLISCVAPIPQLPWLGNVAGVEPGTSLDQTIIEFTKKQLQELRDKHLSHTSAVTTKVLSNPSTAQAICDYARENNADWIIVGTHGRTGMDHMLIGSVAERVVRHADCHVLVARPQR